MPSREEFVALPAVVLPGLPLAAVAGLRWPAFHVGQLLVTQEWHGTLLSILTGRLCSFRALRLL